LLKLIYKKITIAKKIRKDGSSGLGVCIVEADASDVSSVRMSSNGLKA